MDLPDRAAIKVALFRDKFRAMEASDGFADEDSMIRHRCESGFTYLCSLWAVAHEVLRIEHELAALVRADRSSVLPKGRRAIRAAELRFLASLMRQQIPEKTFERLSVGVFMAAVRYVPGLPAPTGEESRLPGAVRAAIDRLLQRLGDLATLAGETESMRFEQRTARLNTVLTIINVGLALLATLAAFVTIGLRACPELTVTFCAIAPCASVGLCSSSRRGSRGV